jgi:hypothetical protein
MLLVLAATVPACGATGTEGTASTFATMDGSTDDTDAGSQGDGDGDGDDDGAKFDVAPSDPACTGASGEGAPDSCVEQAPPGSFEPVVEWTWGSAGADFVWATPLVGNLTDDNDDGAVDLCDVPDVVVMTGEKWSPFHDYSVSVVDGATGELHWSSDAKFRGSINPAMADIDDDGEIEIVAAYPRTSGAGPWDFQMIAIENDGTVLWEEPLSQVTGPVHQGTAVEIADLDNDGDVEILAFNRILDHHGELVAYLPLDDVEADEYHWVFPLSVDLDGDDDLEVILNGRAYHHDGTLLWKVEPTVGAPFGLSMAAVGNFDEDDEPEVLLISNAGFLDDGATRLVEHDGTPIWNEPMGVRGGTTLIDIDGAPPVELGASTGTTFVVARADATVAWTQPVDDASGISSGTAFDFLGDGTPDFIYGDETYLRVWDSLGTPLFTTPRGSGTLYEYPTVADVDNDGSADVVVVSNEGDGAPLQVIRDAEDRWVRARRIYNQYNYRITNISERGEVPVVESRNWLTYNNFRVQAQITADGQACVPPEG